MNTQPPKPAPFPIGARVRYLGKREAWRESVNGGPERQMLIFPGMEVTIVDANPGRRGTGRCLDEADEIYDETRDGHSVYQNADGARRVIHNDSAHEWEVIGAAG